MIVTIMLCDKDVRGCSVESKLYQLYFKKSYTRKVGKGDPDTPHHNMREFPISHWERVTKCYVSL